MRSLGLAAQRKAYQATNRIVYGRISINIRGLNSRYRPLATVCRLIENSRQARHADSMRYIRQTHQPYRFIGTTFKKKESTTRKEHLKTTCSVSCAENDGRSFKKLSISRKLQEVWERPICTPLEDQGAYEAGGERREAHRRG